MGRIKTAAQLQRAATIATAREAALRNRTVNESLTVNRRQTDSAVYASTLIRTSAASSLFKVSISTAAAAFFGNSTGDGGLAAGLTALGLRAPSAVTDPVASKPKNFRPAQVRAMKATSTPTARLTPWRTRVIKYSTATAGVAQAHYAAPISVPSGVATYDLLDARSSSIFRTILDNLGDRQYARFYLTPEIWNNSKN
jgi:hypothetical protein